MDKIKCYKELLSSYPQADARLVESLLSEAAENSSYKIVVLDDDPTGTQTVHGVSVYTDWERDSIRKGFLEETPLFFLLTNSRSMSRQRTAAVHREIAANIFEVAQELEKKFLIISRSDSTLRGHFPLENDVLRNTLSEKGLSFTGDILCPYFREGGRFTVNNIHYVRQGDALVPAGDTEFAADETFGYTSSNLCEYIEEKTQGSYKKEDCRIITLEMLRALDFDRMAQVLTAPSDLPCTRIIVNALEDIDVQIFCIALYRALADGYLFTLRSAAALVKAMGNITSKPLLSRQDLKNEASKNGGVIIVGSHTQKTTRQLNRLKGLGQIVFLEMDSDLVLIRGALERETQRILALENDLIAAGKTVCVSTKRALLKQEGDTPESALARSVQISNALQNCVGGLSVIPRFIMAKGGITSSDIGTKALHNKKATVLGQIQPGVSVWQTGSESKFPGIPFIIFPGNVGNADTLKKAVEKII